MTDAEVKLITDRIEQCDRNLQASATHISGLVNGGVATCAEVKAYNLWATATYNLQKAMLEQLRLASVPDVPALPRRPMFFTWRNVTGDKAAQIDCSGQGLSGYGGFRGLNKAMGEALAGPLAAGTVFLSAEEVQIHPEGDPPEDSPGFDELLSNQGLGFIPLIIAGIAIAATAVAIHAISQLLQTKKIQEETSRRMVLQTEAFKVYTDARMQCQAQCTSSGGSQAGCVAECSRLITKPELSQELVSGSSLGFLGTVGLIAAGVGAGYLASMWWKAGRPLPAFISRSRVAALPDGD